MEIEKAHRPARRRQRHESRPFDSRRTETASERLSSRPVEALVIHVDGTSLLQPSGHWLGVGPDLRCELLAPPEGTRTDGIAAQLLSARLQQEQVHVIMRDDTLQVRLDCGQQRGETRVVTTSLVSSRSPRKWSRSACSWRSRARASSWWRTLSIPTAA